MLEILDGKRLAQEVDEPRPRRRTSNVHPISTPRGLSSNTGPIASAAWLAECELFPKEPKWHALATLAAGDARFHIEIFAEEWGFRFEHGGRESWIRVTDVPFVHGRDDHELLRKTPPLRQLGKLVRSIESTHQLAFDRGSAAIETTIEGGEPVIRGWVANL